MSMSPATCNAELMKNTLDKWDQLIPLGLQYDRYTSDGLDVLEHWLNEKHAFLQMKRIQLAELIAREAEFDERVANSLAHIKDIAD